MSPRAKLREKFPDWKPPLWLVVGNRVLMLPLPGCGPMLRQRTFRIVQVNDSDEAFYLVEEGKTPEKWLRFNFREVYHFEGMLNRFDRENVV